MNAKTNAPAAQGFTNCAHWGKGGSYVVAAPGGERTRQDPDTPLVEGMPTALSNVTLGRVVMGEAAVLGQTSADPEVSTETANATTTTTTPSPDAQKTGAGSDPKINLNKEQKRA